MKQEIKGNIEGKTLESKEEKKQKKFIEGFLSNYSSFIRLLNNSKSREVKVTFNPLGNEKETREEIVKLSRYSRDKFEREKGKILSLEFIPFFTREKLEKELNSLDKKTISREKTKLKENKVFMFYREINEELKKIVFTREYEVIRNLSKVSRLLEREKYILPSRVSIMDYREKFLYLTLSLYLSSNERVKSRENEGIPLEIPRFFESKEEYLEKSSNTLETSRDKFEKISSLVYEFLERKSKDNPRGYTFFLNMGKFIEKENKKSRVTFEYIKPINERVISIYEKSKSREDFFKNLEREFSFINERKLSENRKRNLSRGKRYRELRNSLERTERNEILERKKRELSLGKTLEKLSEKWKLSREKFERETREYIERNILEKIESYFLNEENLEGFVYAKERVFLEKQKEINERNSLIYPRKSLEEIDERFKPFERETSLFFDCFGIKRFIPSNTFKLSRVNQFKEGFLEDIPFKDFEGKEFYLSSYNEGKPRELPLEKIEETLSSD